MNTKILSVTLGVFIAVVMCASVLVPVVSSAEDIIAVEEVDQTPVAREYMKAVPGATVIKHLENAMVVTIDGEDVEYASSHIVLLSDTVIVNSTSTTIHVNSSKFFIGSNAEWTLILSNGVWTLIYEGQEYTDNYAYAYVYSATPTAYGIYTGSAISQLKFNAGDKFGGFRDTGTAAFVMPMTTVTLGTADIISNTKSSGAIGIATASWSVIENDDDTYSVSNLLFDEGSSGEALLAPASYGIHAPNGASNLIHTIPVFVIIAILVGVVALIAVPREE